MGKTLLVSDLPAVVNSGAFILPGSQMQDTATEPNVKLRATEAMTFSNLLAKVQSGNSGQCVLTARKNGAAGNESITIVGVASNEDTVNTDVLAAGDDLALGYTDTATGTVFSVITMNVTFASGHGSIHIAAAPTFGFANLNVPSATRYNVISGDVGNDFEVNEGPTQIRNQAYTSWEAMAITVDNNARTNDSVFRNRINGANGSAAITVGAGLTGTFTDLTVGDALVPGTDLLNVSVTLLTGTENLGFSSMQNVFKSTQLKSQLISSINGTAVTRAASATPTYYAFGGALDLESATEAERRIKPGFTAKCQELGILCSANTYSVDATIKCFVDGVAQITQPIVAGVTTLQINTTDSFDIGPSTVISAEIVGGGTGSITIKEITLTLGPVTSLRANPMLLLGVGRGIAALEIASFILWDEGRIGDISMHGFVDLYVQYESAMVAPGDDRVTDPPDPAHLHAFFLELRDGDGSNPGIGNVPIVLDYEAWVLITNVNSPTGINMTVVGWYVDLINIAKTYFTQVGYYGEIPERHTLYLNFPPGHATFVSRRANWFARNAMMQPMWDAADTIWPSFYYIGPIHINADDRDMWYADNLELCNLHAPGKPAYPFMLPRIHPSEDPDQNYQTGPYWRASLESLRSVGYPGFVLYLNSGDTDPRTLTPVPAWWPETVDFAASV